MPNVEGEGLVDFINFNTTHTTLPIQRFIVVMGSYYDPSKQFVVISNGINERLVWFGLFVVVVAFFV